MTEPTKPDAPQESSRESEKATGPTAAPRRQKGLYSIQVKGGQSALGNISIEDIIPSSYSFPLDSEEADEYRQAVEKVSRRLGEASAEQSSLSPRSTVSKPEMDFSALAQEAYKAAQETSGASLDSVPKQHPLYAFGAGCVMSIVALTLTITASTTFNPNDISARFTAYFLAGLTGSASVLAFSNSYIKKPSRNT